MGTADRVLRWVLAAVFITLTLMDVATGLLGAILLVLGVVFVLTSIVGYCPLYKLFGINTCQHRTAR